MIKDVNEIVTFSYFHHFSRYKLQIVHLILWIFAVLVVYFAQLRPIGI